MAEWKKIADDRYVREDGLVLIRNPNGFWTGYGRNETQSIKDIELAQRIADQSFALRPRVPLFDCKKLNEARQQAERDMARAIDSLVELEDKFPTPGPDVIEAWKDRLRLAEEASRKARDWAHAQLVELAHPDN